MAFRLSLLLLIGLAVPFTVKPVHVDDANFLAMARTAAKTPWTPHDFLINWSGQTESAFDVLSNPPGIAWWLAPVADASIFWMHVWMLPWLVLAIWGAAGLGRTVTDKPGISALLIAGAPISLIATSALTPDLPLLACSLSGVHLLTRTSRPLDQRWIGALLLGTASLFRYSGVALILLAPLWSLLHHDRRSAVKLGLLAATPVSLLFLHDVIAYGQIHMLSMMAFQSTSNEWIDISHKAIATLAALGGAAVLPILTWSRPQAAIVGTLMGATLAGLATLFFDFGTPFWTAILFGGAGGASFAACFRKRDATDQFLLVWILLGFVFLLGLRFSAARYWIPFFAPAILIPLRDAGPVLSRVAVSATLLLSLAVGADDLDVANTHLRAAEIAGTSGSGKIAGHWGFQHHLQAMGWTDVEDDAQLGPKQWVARSKMAWPQTPSNTCWDFTQTLDLGDPNPGIRVLTTAGGANLHGNWIAGPSPIRVVAPWSLASDPIDQLTLRRTCASF